MANLQLFAKAGLSILIIISLGVLIERLTSSRRSSELDNSDIQVLEINTSTFSPTVDIVESSFSEKLTKCLREHSRSYYYPINQGKNISYFCLLPEKCIHDFLTDTSRVMKSFGIRLQLLEPSLLFCMLPSSRKYNLLTRGYSSTEVRGLKNVVTFGIHHSEAKKLDEANARKMLISLGYRIIRFHRGTNGHLKNDFASQDVNEVSHYFVVKHDLVIHLIVFYPRGTYLFSPGFDTSEISLKGLQYVNDRAFENFTTSTEYLDNLSSAPLFLPSDTRCFLLDMLSSEFLECKSVSTDILTVNGEVLMALKELKVILASQMVTFWMWSKSLQGWYEKCDIQHYTDELQFSVAAKSVEGFNFSTLFVNSTCQHIESYSNVTTGIRSVELNCYGVPVHLIFMYEDKITYWYEHIDGESTYKLRFPKFTMCSTDVYGQKVGLPCETGEILESDYGHFLKNTTLNLDPTIMKNVVLLD